MLALLRDQSMYLFHLSLVTCAEAEPVPPHVIRLKYFSPFRSALDYSTRLAVLEREIILLSFDLMLNSMASDTPFALQGSISHG